ncbi:unnamed protein product [Alternaria alternata]
MSANPKQPTKVTAIGTPGFERGGQNKTSSEQPLDDNAVAKCRVKVGILVLGPTGAGKPSFIATVTGSPVVIGHDSVDLIDTPGIDDTIRPGLEILSEIVEFLRQNQHHIAGVVYLHPIQERRLTGTLRLNLVLLQSICGEHFYSHLAIVSTMWDTLPYGPPTTEAERREKEFKQGDDPVIWRDMLDKGSDYGRYIGVDCSSRAIITSLLSKHRAPPLLLELELRDRERAPEDTSAGSVLMAEAKAREEKLQRELKEEQEEAQELHGRLQQNNQLATESRGVGNGISQGDREDQRGIVRRLFG